MNKSFKERFSYEWILYLLVLVISISGWTAIYGIYHSPKNYEKIDIFFAGVINDYSFENEALKYLANTSLIEINISSSNTNDTSFNTKYNVVGLNNSDIVFIPKSIASKTKCEETFNEIDESYNQEFFIQEDKKYGIIIKNDVKEKLNKYFNFTSEEYVILFNEISVNCGKITNNSYDLVKWMVNYEI